MKDDEFGDDIEFDFANITDDRNPSLAIPEDIIKGTLEGFKEDSISEQGKEIASQVIPAAGLGSNYFELSKAKRSMDKTIRDSVTEVQLQAKPIVDVLKDVIPENSFLRKYLRHAEDGGVGGSSTEEEEYDSSAFFKQAKEQKDILLETTSAQVASQDKGTNRIISMLNITNEYNLSYYKKSLEYQYRLLGETTKSNKQHSALLVDSLNILRSINKNVALPDFVKLKTSEAVKATVRERLVGKLFDTDSVKSIGDIIGTNFQNYISTKLATSSDVIEMLSEVASTGKMASDSMSDEDLKEIGKTRTGFIASSLIPGLIREYGGRKLGEYISSMPGMSKYTERVSDAFENSQETAFNIRTKLEEEGKFKRAGIAGFFEQMLKDNNSTSNDFSSFVGSPDETRLFDTRVYDSLTKIIPKYLADIVSLLGGKNETYDFGTGKFIEKNVSSIELGFRQPLETSGEIDILRSLKEKGFTTDEVVEIAKIAKINDMPLTVSNANLTDLSDTTLEKISKITEHDDIRSFNKLAKHIRTDGLKYGNRIEEYYNSGMQDELIKAGIITEDEVSGELYTNEEGLNNFVLKQYKALLDNEKVSRELKPDEKRQVAMLREELKRAELRAEFEKKAEEARVERIVKRRLEEASVDVEDSNGKERKSSIRKYKKPLTDKEKEALKKKPITKREIAEDKALQAVEKAKGVKDKLGSLYNSVKQNDLFKNGLQQVKQDIGLTKHNYNFTTEKPDTSTVLQNPLPPKKTVIDTATGYLKTAKDVGSEYFNTAKNVGSTLFSKLPTGKDNLSNFKFSTERPDGLNTLQPITQDKSIFDVLTEIKDNIITGNETTKESLGLMNDLQSFNLFGVATHGKKTVGSILNYAKTKVSEKTPQFVKDRLGQGKDYVGTKLSDAKQSVVDKVKGGLGIKAEPANNTSFTGESTKSSPVLNTLNEIKQRLTPENDADGNEKSIIGKLIQTVKPKEVRKGSYQEILNNRNKQNNQFVNNTSYTGVNTGNQTDNANTSSSLIGGLFGGIKDMFLSGGVLTKVLMGLGATGLYNTFKGIINGDKDLDIGDRILDYFVDSITPDWLKSASDERKQEVKESIRERHDTSDIKYSQSNVSRSSRRYNTNKDIEYTQSLPKRSSRYTQQATVFKGGAKLDDLDRALLSRIAKGEVNTVDRSGYDEIIGFGSYGKPPKPLTKMTIAEVIAFQRKLLANGSPSTAVGRYQFLKRTLIEEAQRAGIPLSTIFSPEVQDMLILNRLKRMRGYDKYRKGKLKQDDFIRNLSQEFASIENPYTGIGFYKGQNVHTTADQLREVLSGKVTAGQLMLQRSDKQTQPKTGNAQIDSLNTLASGISSFFGSTNNSILGNKSIADTIPTVAKQIDKTKPEAKIPTLEAKIDTSNLEHVQGKTVDGIEKQTKEISTQTSVVKENVNVNKEMLSELKKLNQNIVKNTNPRASRSQYQQPAPLHPVN